LPTGAERFNGLPHVADEVAKRGQRIAEIHVANRWRILFLSFRSYKLGSDTIAAIANKGVARSHPPTRIAAITRLRLGFTPDVYYQSNQYFVTMAVLLFGIISVFLASALAQAPIDLFVNNQRYDITYPCYRQPAIIEGDDQGSSLLAFAEGRNVSACALPLNRNDPIPPASNEIGGLVLRRSTDGGLTWTQPRTIYSGNLGELELCHACTWYRENAG